MAVYVVKNQKGQAVIEYVMILAFMMLILVSFINTFSEAIGRRVQGLNFTLTQFLTTGSCPSVCVTRQGTFENELGN
tara:strand:+ start:1226 stop:1456 length:231 start_codon:yes stop_codon:yes gene_type:complete